MSKTHFVLVHGAFHRALHWKAMEGKLKTGGYTVSTLDLPSVGSDIHSLIPEGALRADIEAIKTVLEEAAAQSDTIIPVFHSYGGIPGGEAAAELSDRAKSKVQCLVYMCAFAIQQGTSLVEHGAPSPWSRTEGYAHWVPDPIPVFYHDAEPHLAEEAAKHVYPHSWSSLIEKTTHAPWKQFSCAYIFCKDDKAISLTVQQGFLAKMSEEDIKKWKTFTLEGGHSPFLTRPEECVDILEQLANS